MEFCERNNFCCTRVNNVVVLHCCMNLADWHAFKFQCLVSSSVERLSSVQHLSCLTGLPPLSSWQLCCTHLCGLSSSFPSYSSCCSRTPCDTLCRRPSAHRQFSHTRSRRSENSTIQVCSPYQSFCNSRECFWPFPATPCTVRT